MVNNNFQSYLTHLGWLGYSKDNGLGETNSFKVSAKIA